MIWAAESPAGQDHAFNTANGDVFRWRWLWPQIAEWFGLDWEGYEGAPRTLEESMTGMEPVWRDLATRYGLVEPDIEVVTDMNKSRTAGFSVTRDTRATIFDHAERYRSSRVIP